MKVIKKLASLYGTCIKMLFSIRLFRIGVIAATVVGIALAALKFSGILSPWLSPGPVSAAQSHGKMLGGFASHAEFEHECLHCHAPVHCLEANRCQECHQDIAQQRAELSGLHGLLPGTDKCQTCHPEHNGRDAVISDFAFENVDHELLTGFSLEHHQVDTNGEPMHCDSCHTDHRFSAETVDCLSCHDENDSTFIAGHAERFGGECLLCHDGYDRMIGFDHNEVFLIEGQHADLACEACHVDQAFVGMSPECVTCHNEPELHAGQFGVDCARCHVAVAWRPAHLTEHRFVVDHGGEGEPDCQTCHVESYAMYTCYGCHDAAEMQEIHASVDTESLAACVECHVTGLPEDDAYLATLTH